MAQRFYLDLDYAQGTPLKHSTVGRLDISSAVMVLLFLIVPFMATYFFGSEIITRIATDRAYLAQGRDVTATVAACEMVSGRNSSRPRFTYSYVVDGQTFEEEHITDNSDIRCEQYPAGTTFAALYLPDNPASSRIIDERVAYITWLTVVGYVLMSLVALALCFITLAMVLGMIEGVRNTLRHERLRSGGRLIDGELVAVKGELIGKYGTDYNITVTYRFQTPDGKTLTRQQRHIRSDLRDAKLPPIGAVVSVLYADDDAYVML